MNFDILIGNDYTAILVIIKYHPYSRRNRMQIHLQKSQKFIFFLIYSIFVKIFKFFSTDIFNLYQYAFE